jgi:hypothetical protein
MYVKGDLGKKKKNRERERERERERRKGAYIVCPI